MKQIMANCRFQILLGILLTLFAVMPFFENVLLMDLVSTAVLIYAVIMVSDNRWLLATCSVLAALAIAAIWLTPLIKSKGIVLTANALDLSFFLLLTVIILFYVFRARRITRETIAGALCAYLFMGLMWADAFSLLENVVPGSYSSGAIQPGTDSAVTSPRLQVAHFSYFSMVTLSTLGYGDVTPLTRPARALACLEAIIGQLYLAVLIARLVGQHMGTNTEDNEERA